MNIPGTNILTMVAVADSLFYVGQKFSCFDDLENCKKEYEMSNFCNLTMRDAKTLQSMMKYAPKKAARAKKELRYYSLRLCCTYGGKKFKKQGEGKRETESRKVDCGMCVRLILSDDGDSLDVVEFSANHSNHIVHFAPSEFEQNQQDGWHKMKWTAVPTLRPPFDENWNKKFVQDCLTERKPDTSLKLIDDDEFRNGVSETSANSSADMVTHLGDQQESETKVPSRKLCTLSVSRDSTTLVVRDKKVLKDLLKTLAENIQKTFFQLQETSNKKLQLMQAVKALTQQEIELQRRLKKESDKENIVKQQLQEIENEEKDLWKEDEPGCELDTLMQHNDRQDMITECWKVEEPCCEDGNSSDQSTHSLCSVETDLLSPRPMPPPRKYECVEHFLDAREMQNHELTTHGTEFRCNICDKVFWNCDLFVAHQKTHSDEKPFGCTLCEQRFRSYGTLARHFRYHTREKHYACSVCPERFFYSYQRRVHMSIHTGKQAYWCKECQRGFSSKFCLTAHLRIHSGEKPYECNVCGKRFRNRYQIIVHKETHGEKPYVCYRCGKRLGAGSFWPHMKTHSGIKVYHQCAVCDKKLSSKSVLEMHTRVVHMGEAPYVCDICCKGFGKSKDYKLHKKEHDDCSSKVK